MIMVCSLTASMPHSPTKLFKKNKQLLSDNVLQKYALLSSLLLQYYYYTSVKWMFDAGLCLVNYYIWFMLFFGFLIILTSLFSTRRPHRDRQNPANDALLLRLIARDLLHALSHRHDNTWTVSGEPVVGTGGDKGVYCT